MSPDSNTWNRGYELLRSQILEEGTQPELKEGFYVGDEISKDHPYFINKRLNSGPNVWPNALPDVEDFKKTTQAYYDAAVALAKDILKVLALTLDLSEDFFNDYAEGAVATMRMLHYPPQQQDSDAKLARGIGAHTDFGGITILMQDEVDGLQVWDKDVADWFDVTPIKGAFVVNLGNLMMRWSNDRYISNLHRVINRSGKERYSIPLFFSGNPDHVIECLPNCKKEGEESKYPPITVEQAVLGGYSDSYGRAVRYKKALESQEKVPVVLAKEVAVA
jgi:isopenicillin N synthase-like dioxygenase